ncbi:hypothetical protein QWZ06_23550 [Chryseobacterium tructae]|uniref:hypothetical protein n=1 Tax=Chryseobacterium tructae TaxID=1037380 RepID=UPI0025B59362|nr:hypothetical protein [Chryseobacterium tructae]MDN3694996.1 hypothetical protein [Chryseobacterium tructae]
MHYKDNKKYPQFQFIIIYYDVIKELELADFESYILLYYLMKISKGNEIGKINMSKIEEKLYSIITRKTLHKKLKVLIEQNHIIEEEKGRYRLNADTANKFTPIGHFLIVYFEFMLAYKIRLKKYLLLYLTYSLFRKSKNNNGFFNEETFCYYLGIKKSMLSKHKKDLIDREFIIKQGGTQYKIPSFIYEEFEKLKTKYKIESE